MADIFNEIDEELQYERFTQFWKQNYKLVIALAVGILLATAAYSIWYPRHIKQQTIATGELLDAAGSQDPKKLQALAEKTHGGMAAQANITLAGDKLAAGDKDAALPIYIKLMNDRDTPEFWRDLARYNAASLQLDKNDVDAATKTAQPLTAKNNVFRPLALELSGLIAAKRNDKKAAYDSYAALSAEDSAPAALRDRARAMMRLYQ